MNNRARYTTTKNDLARQVASDCGMTIAQAEQMIDSVIKAVSRSVKAGNRVEFRKFGVFEQRRRKARMHRRVIGSVMDEAAVRVPAATRIVFTASRSARDFIGE